MRDGYFTCFEAGCLPVANTYARAMRYAYHPDYFVQLPPRHPFPMAKYPLVYQRLLGEGVLRLPDVLIPDEAQSADLALVHTPGYLQRLASGSLEAGGDPPDRCPVVVGALAPVEAGGTGHGRSRARCAGTTDWRGTWREAPTTRLRITARASAC